MEQPPPSSPHVPPAPALGAPAAPPVVRVVAKPGFFQAAIGIIVGAAALGAVFFLGLSLGAFTMFAGSMAESPVMQELYRDGDRNRVAIIQVRGVIDPIRAETVRVLADDVLATRSIKAVVLRVDSPGGSIAPSDQIWYQVKRLRDAGLPVVASYGGLAASGGYYISCGADHIVAEPTCITGSIGVIAQTFILKDLMDKVGIEPVTLLATDSPQKDIGNPFRPWTEEDHLQYVEMLDAAYAIFHTRVKEGRATVITDPARIDELADGSIFTAQEALDSGLVDAVGYLDDAIAAAESRAGIRAGKATVVIMREPVDFWGSVLGVRTRDRSARLGDADSIRSLVNELGSTRVMYLMR
ncbi:MAG: signal peptide peptidase SppA [Planctomycetota bacterium]